MNKILNVISILFIASSCFAGEPQSEEELLKGAYEVKFSETKYPRERRLVYNLYKDEINEVNEDEERVKKFGKADEKDVGVDLYDLNGDGVKEIIATIYAYPAFCWGAGCPFYIFKQNLKTKSITDILDLSGKGAIFISQNSTNGYKDIIYYDSPKKFHIWKWDGKQYN